MRLAGFSTNIVWTCRQAPSILVEARDGDGDRAAVIAKFARWFADQHDCCAPSSRAAAILSAVARRSRAAAIFCFGLPIRRATSASPIWRKSAP